MKFLSFCLAASLAVACTGSSDGDGPRVVGPDPSEEVLENPSLDPDLVLNSKLCQEIDPGASPMRRLSNAEYENTVGDLLGVEASRLREGLAGFVSESESLGFRNNANFLSISQTVAQQFMGAAEKFAKLAAENDKLVDCENKGDQKACAAQFVRKFGLRAYRRPLTDEEAERLEAVFEKALSTYDFKTGVEWTVYSMLQSPNFLFRVEDGQEVKDKDYLRPTGYEMASRLSYLLWQSMPDEALFEAAEQGKLNTPEQVAEQAARMIEDSKASRTLEFYRQWLDTDSLKQYKRDEQVFKGLPSNLGDLLRQEVDVFTQKLVLEDNGTFDDLVSAPYTYVNKALAQHYRIEGSFDDNFKRVERAEGSGVLTQGGFITAHDKPTRTSIVLRGLKMRTDMMCDLISAPPNNVSLDLEAVGPNLTQRERLEQHVKDPSCAGCHKMMDPLGMVFEGIDAVGRSRTSDEEGKPVKTDSEIVETLDLDGQVSTPQDIGKRFAASQQARQCYIDQSFRFFYGRNYEENDVCSRAKLAKAFVKANYKLKDLLVGLTQTDTFLYRPVNKQ